MKTILIVSVILFSATCFGQFYVIPRQISGDTNSCTNTVVIESYNALPNSYMMKDGPLTPHLESGDTLTDFCFGLSSDSRIMTYISNGYSDASLGFTTLVQPHHYYHIVDYTQPTTKLGNDGTLTLVFDSVITAYNFSIDQSYNYILDTVWIDNHTLRLDSLTTGGLTILIQHPVYLSDYAFFEIPIADYDRIYPTTGLDVGVSYHHSNGACEGWITLQPQNAVGSVYYAWNEPVMSTATRLDLCPGVYSVYSNEIINNYAYFYNASIDTIVLANDDYTYVDTNLYSIATQDTSVYNFINCGFNYDAQIDSLTYTEDTLYNSGGLVIVTFTMTVYQDTNAYVLSDSLVMLNDSLIFLDVVIYCPELKSNDFAAQRIKFLRGASTHGFEQFDLGVAIAESNRVRCFPNPTIDELKLEISDQEELSKVSIVDLNGNQILLKENYHSGESISIEGIANGTYIVVVETKKGTYRTSFSKI